MGAKKLLGGSILYKDFIDMKPPGIYVVYAALVKISGEANLLYAIKIATLFFQVTTAFVLYRIAAEISNRKNALISAVAFIAALSVNRTGWLLYVFTVTLLPWAFSIFFLVRGNFRLRAADLFYSGFFLALAVLCSTQFIIFAALLPLSLLVTGIPARQFFFSSSAFLTGFLLPLISAAAYFYRHAALYDWYWCNFVWIKYYNGGQSLLAAGQNLLQSFVSTYTWIPLYVLAAFGALNFFRHRKEISRQRFVFILCLGGLFILSRLALTRPAGRYNIYLLPLFALCLGFADFSRAGRIFRYMFAAVVAALFIWVNAEAIAYPPDTAALKTQPLSDWVRKNIPEHAKIFIWNNGIFLYQSSGRDMATGFFFPGLYLDNPGMAARMRGEDLDFIWQKFRVQLLAGQPAYIIDITGNFSAANENSRPAKIRENMARFREYVHANYFPVQEFPDLIIRFENPDSRENNSAVKIWQRSKSH